MPYADLVKRKIHQTWGNMIWRCYRPEHTSYKYYGDRGINVCAEWQTFEPFYEWALVNGYADNLTIDRIDVNGNYCPENCRWVTAQEQANNRRSNHYIEHDGEIRTVTEWAKKVGISSQALSERLSSGNWTVDEALTISKKARKVKQPLFEKSIYQMSANRRIIKRWDSIRSASNSLNIPNSNISRALTNNRYSAGGYYWEYAEK